MGPTLGEARAQLVQARLEAATQRQMTRTVAGWTIGRLPPMA